MIEESGVHRLTHRVITAEGEGDVAESPASLGAGEGSLDLSDCLDEVDGVVVVLLDPGGDRQDIRVEDDVLGVESDLVHEQAVGAGADAHLVLLGSGLTLLVEGHDNHCGAVALGEPRALQEGLLSILEADGVEDGFTLEALDSLFEDRPLGTVDHDRYTTDLRICGKQVQKGLHDRFAIEHPLVDVHIEDIGTALDLLARHREGRLVIAGDDELRKLRRTGDVSPFTDHHEGASFPDDEGLKSAEA